MIPCSRVRSHVIEALGDSDGVLGIDETGFLRKGGHSAGVGRQHSGTAGRIGNCRIGVFASHASRWGHALIGRRLSLPKDWAGDAARREKAHLPEDAGFATEPAMACEMVARLPDQGASCAFVPADAVHGSDHRFRRMLEARGQPYVLAVRSTHALRFLEEWQVIRTDPAAMIAELPPEAWQPLGAGEGARGLRLHDWSRLPIRHEAEAGFSRWLLARRSLRDPEAIACCFAHAPADATLADLADLADLAAAAGLRRTIEDCFQRARDDLGLDHCGARSWHGWHRHMSLVMAAAAFLARIAAAQRRAAFGKPNEPSPAPRTAAARSQGSRKPRPPRNSAA